jgi:hypothetical protein
MNLQALLREAIEVCAVARDFSPLQRALTDVFAEATHASRRDPVLAEHFRGATSVLEDPKLKEQTPAALSHAEHTALHLLDTLRSYPELNITLLYKDNHVFAGGLADKLEGLLEVSTTYIRNFYLVLRK